MEKNNYVVLAQVELNDGIDEKTFYEASDKFQKDFVDKQTGIVKRDLLKLKEGHYADLVVFESKEDFEKISKIEESSEVCMEFFKLMKLPENPEDDILAFEFIKTYKK